MDVLVTASVVATVVYWYRVTSDSWFYVDEWPLALRGYSLGDFFEPYNGHLSVVYIGIYRLLYKLVGFEHYGAFRMIGMLSLASVPVALYLTTKARIGSGLAGIIAVSFLWFHGMALEPGGMNHPLALTAGVLCAHFLPRPGRRNDLWVAVTLTAALATAGGGVAVAVGAVVYLVCGRPDRRRWAAVLVPCAGWGLWWLALGRSATPETSAFDIATRDLPNVVYQGLFQALGGLALGRGAGGALLLAVFVALVGWQLRLGLRESATTVAWTAAAVAWWLGLALNRGSLATPETFRYQFVAAAFLTLAIIPPLADLTRRVPAMRWSAPPVVAVVGLLLVSANIAEVRAWASAQAAWGASAQRQATLGGADPTVLPPETAFGFVLSNITQGDYLELSSHYGSPISTPRSELDRAMIRQGVATVVVGVAGSRNGCPGANPVFEVPLDGSVAVRTLERPVRIAARRFGSRFVTLKVVPPRSRAVVRIATEAGDRPWIVSAEGGCRAKG